jgi:multiple sugar transport system permease protein
VTAPQRRRRSPHRDGRWAVLFVGGLLLGVTTFYLWPIVRTAYLSFFTLGDFGRSENWVGVDNYAELFTGSNFGLALTNTVVYTAILLIGVPISVALAALVATPGLRGANVYRTLFFLPYIAMPMAIALVWRLIFNGDFGILNYGLSLVGIDGPSWLSTPGLAILTVGVVGLWSSIGFSMIILGAGLRAIPTELYEAASLDGADRAQLFRHVTVPMLRPSIFFVSVLTVIHGFQVFDLLFGLLGNANPALASTRTIVYYFYDAAFIANDKGFGAAVAIVIMFIIGTVTAVQFRLQKRGIS